MVKNLTQIKVVPFFAGRWYQFSPTLKMTLQLEQYKIEKNKEKYKELRDSIYYKIYPEEQDQ